MLDSKHEVIQTHLLGLTESSGIELVQFGLQELLVGKVGLVLGDQRGGQGAAEGVLDHFVVFAGAQEHADRWTFVRLADVAVEGFQIELQLAQMLGLELTELELDGDQAGEAPMEEQQVEREVATADMQGHFAANEAEVAAQLGQKAAEVAKQALMQVGLAVISR